MAELVKNEYGLMKPEESHVCDFGSRPMSRWSRVKGYSGPVEEWVCACGVRRVSRAGAGPNSPEPRDAAFNDFQDHNERSLFYGTGQMGVSNPAMWLTAQQEKSNG
jgi:hypothetical protein